MNLSFEVLGTGAGASAVYQGLPSSSVMLLSNGEPFCLIDLGLGVGQRVIQRFGRFPKQVVVTHNHSDHAGELPVVLRVAQAQGQKMQVVSAAPVAERLQAYRMAEHLDLMQADEIADWVAVSLNQSVVLGQGLHIQFFPGVHSELSFGFALFDHTGSMRLSYTGDSRLHSPLYEKLAQADCFLVDARPQSNPWHADFQQVAAWMQDRESIPLVLGHGLTSEAVEAMQSKWPFHLLKMGEQQCF